MQTTKLGRTGLDVSVAGLGCGGNSRIGLGRGLSTAESVRLVHRAFDLGVTFIDTAEVYGTEDIVGAALGGRDRSRVVVSTKSRYQIGGRMLRGAEVIASLNASLGRLRTDHVDVFHVHAVKPEDYDYVLAEIAPALRAERERGTIRHIGITESPPSDPDQTMLKRALSDDVWEVVMLGFHMMHQGARRTVLSATQRQGIGTLIMFAVRNIFSRPDELRAALASLAASGRISRSYAEAGEPLDFLIHDGGASSLTDAAYRFARHQPGVDVVLFGTGSIAHLEANIRSITAPPLPDADVRQLHEVFGDLIGIGLDLPDHVKPKS